MDFDTEGVPPVQETENVGPAYGARIEVPPAAATPLVLPDRRTVPLNITSSAPPRNTKPRKLKTDQIVAIVLLVLLLGGIICVTLALCGVFNRTPPGISLTPTVVITSRVPNPLPSVVIVG